MESGVRVLLLAPSGGLGGGIERYADGVGAILDVESVPWLRLNVRSAGEPFTLATRLRFVRTVRRHIRESDAALTLVFLHANLLPVLALVSRLPSFRSAVVIMHGDEIWAGRRIRGGRWLRRGDVRVVAASNFSAGALTRTCHATVVASGIAPEWYATLINAAPHVRPPDDELHLVTAFRLGSWQTKGLGTILDAIASLRTDRIRLTVCGIGPVPAALQARVDAHSWCRVVPDLPDAELADELARADAFLLATRTHGHANPSGEGFGLVLLEAQLAGTMVIAPAYGGSGDAFQPGMTGVAPIDESPEALAAEIAALLDNPKRRREMSEAAAAWSRVRFHPETYAQQLLRTISTAMS